MLLGYIFLGVDFWGQFWTPYSLFLSRNQLHKGFRYSFAALYVCLGSTYIETLCYLVCPLPTTAMIPALQILCNICWCLKWLVGPP